MEPAILVLEDGTVFRGRSVGAKTEAVGEVVFNTSMTGYQEILTDPSYAKQLVTLTYPDIGNVGTNSEDLESAEAFAEALIIRDLPSVSSNFRKHQDLGEFLEQNKVPAIADIDTRKLTRIIREGGAQSGCLMTGAQVSEAEALQKARQFRGLAGLDLVKEVGTKKVYDWNQTEWSLEHGYQEQRYFDRHVVVFDFGIKFNILRKLASRRCKLTVVPANTTFKQVLEIKPDGIFLSNGPGDPEPCDYAIETIRYLLEQDLPIFGICLGHQLLGLASGAKTLKMKFGHHGANHPVKDLASKKVIITSQNHGFSVDESTLPNNLVATHISLFDGSIQGMKRLDKPAFGFQGHPEASPGPQDIDYLFDKFTRLMDGGK